MVGYGRAEKQQVKLMVHSLLGLETQIDSEDACDAIAVAICHATHASYRTAAEGGAMKPDGFAFRLCAATLCAAPQLFYSKFFKGSVPEFVAITVDRDGQATYQEAKEDDNPIQIQLDRADTAGNFRPCR